MCGGALRDLVRILLRLLHEWKQEFILWDDVIEIRVVFSYIWRLYYCAVGINVRKDVQRMVQRTDHLCLRSKLNKSGKDP